MLQPFERNRYFAGKLLTEEDFENEQRYHRRKRQLHNVCLHGWGVVCGLRVLASRSAENEVIVQAGYALDASGNDIVVPDDVTVRVEEPAGDPSGSREEPTKHLFLTVDYEERESGFVPPLGPGTRVEGDQPVATRIVESYRLSLQWRPNPLPEDGVPEGAEELRRLLHKRDVRAAVREFLAEIASEACSCEPWDAGVTLAAIRLGEDGGRIVEIDNHSHRRVVWSTPRTLAALGGVIRHRARLHRCARKP